MREKKYKWLPSYNTIMFLSILAAIMVTSAFVYFSVTFFQAEKTISRQTDIESGSKDAVRALIISGLGSNNKSPIEAGLLEYLSKKLREQVVPVQRLTPDEAKIILSEKTFDLAFTDLETFVTAKDDDYIEPLVVPVVQDDSISLAPISIRKGTDEEMKLELKKILLNMNVDEQGKKVLYSLGIEKFVEPPSSASPGN